MVLAVLAVVVLIRTDLKPVWNSKNCSEDLLKHLFNAQSFVAFFMVLIVVMVVAMHGEALSLLSC